MTPGMPVSCLKGCVELAEIRQLASSFGQETSLGAIDGQVSITLNGVVVLQPRNDVGQELNLSLPITIRSKVVHPNRLAFRQGGSVADGVLEVLLTARTWSPEPVNTHEANVAAGRLAQVQES